MSREDYQRAMGDLLRSPAQCSLLRSSASAAMEGYDLTPVERQRLQEIARHRGMEVNCMLYRASRLVGIMRRLPLTVGLLGPALRDIFDAYLEACPDAPAAFDQEARAFAHFVAEYLDTPDSNPELDAELLRAIFAKETATLAPSPSSHEGRGKKQEPSPHCGRGL